MFTNEMNFDESITTIMDETGEYEDVQVFISDDTVQIRQFPHDETIPADIITLTPKMFRDLIEAMNQPEGFYRTSYK